MQRIKLVAQMPFPPTLCFSTGVVNVRPARISHISRIRIFASQDKTKLHDKQTRRQQVEGSLRRSVTWFSLLIFLWKIKVEF